MSILIKGMKMPRNCFVCPLSVVVGERLVCEVTRDEVLRWKIDFNCPLIELPPHGRLIDADIAEVIVCDESESGDFNDGILYAADWIASQPTVIEAEEE